MQIKMRDLNISKELKIEIENNQNCLKSAIRNHQSLFEKLQDDPNNNEFRKQIEDTQQEIIMIGLEQKGLIERLRQELKEQQKAIKLSANKNGVEEKRLQLTNVLNRNRKQTIITRTASVTSLSGSDDSADAFSGQSTPELSTHPVSPHDVSQSDFLHYFSLATHDVYKEMQKKRVERKRRSTANPQFLYGARCWDYTTKRQKRGNYLVNMSPPNTRQAVKKAKAERTSPTLLLEDLEVVKKVAAPFPVIPNLPSGLTIERVSPSRSTPDPKACIVCKQTGNLSVCEMCFNGFHVTCHDRPLSQSPRHCPRCIVNKEVHTVGSLNVPSGMSVSYVSAAEASEKLEEKRALQEKYIALAAELSQLKERHSQLTMSLKNQTMQREELLSTQQSTEMKIKQILEFVNGIKAAEKEPSQN